MSKIDRIYNFILDPLERKQAVKSGHLKRAGKLTASVLIGLLSASIVHAAVYKLHKHSLKKRDAQSLSQAETAADAVRETNLATPERRSSSSSSTSVHTLPPSQTTSSQTSESESIEEGTSSDSVETPLYTEEAIPIPHSEEEVKELKRKARRGDHEAQFILGNYFEVSLVESNLEKAKSYFEQAAQANHLRALYRLALLTASGIKGSKNYEEARELLQIAAAQGYPRASTELGDLDAQGLGRDKRSYKEARQHYEEAAKHNEVYALIALADLCKKGLGGDCEPERARKLYKMAIVSGLHPAIYGLAECYEQGIGGKKNIAKAIQLYESIPHAPKNIQDKIQKLKSLVLCLKSFDCYFQIKSSRG